MSNLTVSSAVDGFMESTDAQDMAAAIIPGFAAASASSPVTDTAHFTAINASSNIESSQYIIGGDVQILGTLYFGAFAESMAVSGGVVTIQNSTDNATLKATQNVGEGSATGTSAAATQTAITVSVSGCTPGDIVVANLGDSPGFSAGLGPVIQSAMVTTTGTVTVWVKNDDPVNSYSITVIAYVFR